MAGLLDFLKDETARKQIVGGLLDAGNRGAVAGLLGGPVDLATMALRPFGYSTGKPVMGSEWIGQKMQDAGLVSENRNPVAEALAGFALPAAAYAAGPKLYAAEQAIRQNASAPTPLNTASKGQSGMILFHGSNDSRPVKAIHDGGVFGGIFASPSQSSASGHGSAMYRMTVPDEAVMSRYDDVDWDLALETTKKFLPKGTPSSMIDELTDYALDAKSAWDSGLDEATLLRALRATDMGEADWALQSLRGKIAKDAGFKAVAMPDEHGTSYLVLPGVKPRPANDAAKTLFKQNP